MKSRPSLEKRRKELQRQNKKVDKAERRRQRKEQHREPGAGPPVEALTPGELGLGTDSDSETPPDPSDTNEVTPAPTTPAN